MPYNTGFFGAHFYAPAKNLFGKFIDTFYANLMVLWAMSLLLVVSLFFDLFPKGIGMIERMFKIKTTDMRVDGANARIRGRHKP
jgi:hypothetical protein